MPRKPRRPRRERQSPLAGLGPPAPAPHIRFRPTHDGLGWVVSERGSDRLMGEIVMTMTGVPRFWPYHGCSPSPAALRLIDDFVAEKSILAEPSPPPRVSTSDPTLKAPWE